MDDALDLLQWKNDWDTRRFSIVTEQIIFWSNHLGWLHSRLDLPGFYIIEVDGVKVGDVRFDLENETEVSIRLAPKFRGRGYATQAIREGMKLHPPPYIAKIVEGNTASYRLFTSLGFTLREVKEKRKQYSVLTRGA